MASPAVTGKRKAPGAQSAKAVAPVPKINVGKTVYTCEAYGLSEDGVMYLTDGRGKLVVYGTRSALQEMGGPVQLGPRNVPYIERTGTARLGPFLARPLDAESWTLTRCEAPAEVIRLRPTTPAAKVETALTARQRDAVARRQVDYSDFKTVVARRDGETFAGVRVAVQGHWVVCYDCIVDGTGGATVRGDRNIVRGDGLIVTGDHNYVLGNGCSVEGFAPITSGRDMLLLYTGWPSSPPALRAIHEKYLTQLVVKDNEIRELRNQAANLSFLLNQATRSLEESRKARKRFDVNLERATEPVPPLDPAAAAAAVTCSVCLEWTCDLVLACGHLICTACARRLPRSDKHEVACPRCRKATKQGLRVFI